MAKYVYRPLIINAYQITEVRECPDAPERQRVYALTCDDGQERVTKNGMCARMVPQVEDYWVVAQDGYEYINPKTVFESKFDLLGEPQQPA